ncbi:MAG TPA: SdrD B-like domain-containing protein, partial [Bryobacteraceae bacterium]
MTRSTNPSISIAATNTQQAVFFTVTFSGLPAGLTLKNQSYMAWCPDFFGDFTQNNNSTPYTPYNTYGNSLPVNAQSPNWDKVNWLLNHQPTGAQATWILQQVMWRLLAGQYAPAAQGYPLPEPATDNLYNQALTQGAGFVPAPGQLMGIMMYIDGMYPSAPADIAANPNLPTNGQPNVFQDVLLQVPVPNQGAIGDYVWQDTNQNGIQDAGEPGINGVTVQLCSDSACGAVLATTTTSTFQGLNGYYQFTDLGPGTYYVLIDNSQPALSGLVPTQTGQGTPATDSNPNPSQVILTTDTSTDETIDFGYTPPGTSAIGDFVWNDSNGNGLQDSGEPGISGVKVNLCRDAACSTIVATTTTDQNGAYHFTGLLAGTYYVVIDSTTLPPGFVASPSQVGFPGNAAIDSNGSPAQVILPENFTDNTIDFGFVPPAQGAIGDFVWHDLNRNGIQDNDSNNNPEPGINSVTVRLYNSSNTLVGTTTTVTANGHDGYYQFTGLAAGTYTVVLDSTTLPPGYTPTTSNAPGSTAANDSNGSPATVTLATNSSVDETIDFGFVSPCVGAIGDFVWNDANQNGIQDSNELGIPG